MFLAAIAISGTSAADREPPRVAVVVGAEGAPEYGEAFAVWAGRWEQAASKAGASWTLIGRDDPSGPADRERLKQLLAENQSAAASPLWLVLIGHGTYFGDTAKFNLRGPDVSSRELAEWLGAVERPLVIINCASSSGAFLRDLAAPGRVIVTATQSGAEQNYARFGDFLSQSIADAAADLDHDKQVSLLEAFLSASGQVAQFYEDDARLATEHALLEDTGDGLGTPATFFRGVRAVREARDNTPLDGSLAARTVLIPGEVDRGFSAEQLARREQIEAEIDRMRHLKSGLDEATYYTQLQPWLVELAQLYEEAEHGPAIEREGLPPAPVD